MHELLRPFKPSDLNTTLKTMSEHSLVKEVKEEAGLILFTTSHPLKDAEEHPHFFKKDNYYLKNTFEGLKSQVESFPGILPHFAPEMLPAEFKFPSLINFEIQKKKYYLPLSEVLNAAEMRCPVTRVVFKLAYSGTTPEESLKSILPLLKDLSEHVLWKKHPELKKDEVTKDLVKKFKGDEKFVKFWIKESDIKPEQLTCKHVFTPNYSPSGLIDKEHQVCRKCLFSPLQSFDGKECKLSFKAWNAARKAYLA